VISGFYRYVDENCATLGYYAASNGNSLPTFRYNKSVPSSMVTRSKKSAVVVQGSSSYFAQGKDERTVTSVGEAKGL
jgi:hypothetical protein